MARKRSTRSQKTGFADRLRALREDRGLTQEDLARLAGISVSGYAKLENEVNEPSWPTVLALARALGVNCLAFTETVAPASA